MIFHVFFDSLFSLLIKNGSQTVVVIGTFLTYFFDTFLDCSQKSFRGGSGIDFGWILKDFGRIYEGFLEDFGRILGAFWERFGSTLGIC